MDSSKLNVLITSVELGSFSKAAEQLGYTVSGVSQLIRSLEKEVGFPLLIREKTGVTPTENALKIIPIMRDIMNQEERIQQISQEIRGLTAGSVTIGSFSSVSSHWLPAVIKSFQKTYPQIDIHVMEGIRQVVEGWLSERRVDMAFFSYKEPMNYEWIPLAKDPIIAVLPRTHPLADQKVYPLENCQHERFIMPGLGQDEDIIEIFTKNNLNPKIVASTIETFSTLAMIEQGMGMSIINELITKKLQYNIVKLPVDPPHHIVLGIALHSLESASPAARRFVDYATQRLKRNE